VPTTAPTEAPTPGTIEGSPAKVPGLPPALPVLLTVAGGEAEQVQRWVEGVLGWQAAGEGVDDLTPRIRLLDVAAAASAAPSALPTVLLAAADTDVTAVADAATRCLPDRTLRWPADRDRLPATVRELLALPRRRETAGRLVRVGGSAGGVGTSTVALALAGLAAWSGTPTVVAVGTTAPVGELPGLPASSLVAPDAWRGATPVAGVARLRGLRVADGLAGVDAVPPDEHLGVLDVGVGADVDVLVARADAAGLEAMRTTTAAGIVVVGAGPASATAVNRACGDRRRVDVPWSARVARAGLHRRIPTGLPGRWVAALRPLTPTSHRPRPG
jgi:hypothetical protein